MDNPEIDKDGTQRWRDENDELHRDGGPAVIRVDGFHVWFQHGFHHRADGPAVIYTSGKVAWYFNHVEYTFEDWLDVADISAESKVMIKLQYG